MPPASGEYFDVISPTTGKVFTKAALGKAADVEAALDAAHKAATAWGATSAAERARVLDKVAQVFRDNTELLAYVETIDNGKVRVDG